MGEYDNTPASSPSEDRLEPQAAAESAAPSGPDPSSAGTPHPGIPDSPTVPIGISGARQAPEGMPHLMMPVSEGTPVNQQHPGGPVPPGGGREGFAPGGPIAGPPYFPGPAGPPPMGTPPPPMPGAPNASLNWQPGPAGWQQEQPRPDGRGGRRATFGILVAVGAVALSLFSGAVGAVMTHELDRSSSTNKATHQASPVLVGSSVAAVAEEVRPSVVDITTGEGEGSGVILTADGSILTNNHVVATTRGDSQLTVTFSNGKSAQATIVGTDPTGDLAVIKAQNVSGLTAAKFGDSSALHIGDTVLAIGSPLGLQGSVTQGIVSALNRPISTGDEQTTNKHGISDAIQTDAAINPGNSGGALVNLAGEVIGINTAIATSGEGAGSIGLGFAIPSNKAKSSAAQLMSGNKVEHPYLGVSIADSDDGALVRDVVSNGPAAKAGVIKGDLITAVNAKPIKSADELLAAIQAAKTGDEIGLTVRRNGTEQQFTAKLGTMPS
jgi:putative serine protease PepD